MESQLKEYQLYLPISKNLQAGLEVRYVTGL